MKKWGQKQKCCFIILFSVVDPSPRHRLVRHGWTGQPSGQHNLPESTESGRQGDEENEGVA